uniref:histidine kinase n=1 Tax=Magnetococcus massalia (strain MO-1) TaxID=451514 RepID=A0A1S7LIW0_MAGMO|nr:Putative sensor histidine kinase. Containing HAMP domain, PAS fold domain, His Kinase A (phosphoacceptor) domain and Histidine kinase-, DNA gyrase B-, and HSP90-like ATPase doamin [Candidatus Magnetococcus massalia]
MAFGIRGKLFLVFFLLILVVGSSAGLYLDRALSNWLESQVRNELSRYVNMGRFSLEQHQGPFSADALDPLADNLGRSTTARITLIDPHGAVLGDSQVELADLSTLDNHDNRPEVQEARSGGFGTAIRWSATVRAELFYVATPYLHQDGSQWIVRAAHHLKELEPIRTRLRMMLMLAAILAILAAIAVSALAAHFSTRRFRHLMGQVHALSREALSDLPEAANLPRDELGMLDASFRQMASELKRNVISVSGERKLFQSILHEMADGLLVLDDDQRVLLYNPMVESMLGLDGGQLGEPLSNFLPLQVREQLFSAMKPGSVTEGTAEIQLAGEDHARYIEVQWTPMAENHGCIMVFHDNTVLRRQELIRKDFIANVSHELRTPISILQANAETLLSGALGDKAYSRQLVTAMERHAVRLSHIITRLLDLSRLESDEFVLQRELVNLSSLVNNVVEHIKPLAQDRDITFWSMISPEATCLADREAVEEVLTNLVNNAVKYIPEKSQITISCRDQGDLLRIEVADNGPGIDPVHFPRIFERFYRVDKGRSRDMGGTGLGLAIVKQMIRKMGGQVGLESVDPQGSRFWFTVPKDQSSSASTSERGGAGEEERRPPAPDELIG